MTKKCLHRVLAIALFAIAPFLPSNATEIVPVLTYHSHPPFQTGAREGLTWELASYLTSAAGGRYRFEVQLLSRPAVNKALANGKVAVIPWVNPSWFSDRDEQRHVWARHILMNDGNAVISRRSRPIDYTGPASMQGMVLGGLRGHKYTQVDDYIKATGQLRRVDANNLTDNIEKLREGRIDVTLMPLGAARYLLRHLGLEDTLYISPSLQQEFERRIIVSGRRTDIADFLDQALTHPAWKARSSG